MLSVVVFICVSLQIFGGSLAYVSFETSFGVWFFIHLRFKTHLAAYSFLTFQVW